jgi:guanine deaminase
MSEPRDADFMRAAIRLALRHSASGRRGPFGALVTRNGIVVGQGGNEVVRRHDPAAHAEIVALRAAGRRLRTHVLRGCVLYSSCEPCPMCLAAAYWARIDRIVFAATQEDAAQAGFDDAEFYRELVAPPGKRRLAQRNILRRQGRRVLELWQLNPRKTPY